MPTKTTETARVPEDLSGRQRLIPVGGITWRHTLRALRHRNYRLFFWGQLVSLTGTWMQQTAMSWFVYQITNSKLLLGVVAAGGSAPMSLSSIWGGSLAGRHPDCRNVLGKHYALVVRAFLPGVGVGVGCATPLEIVLVTACKRMAMGCGLCGRDGFEHV